MIRCFIYGSQGLSDPFVGDEVLWSVLGLPEGEVECVREHNPSNTGVVRRLNKQIKMKL